MKTVPSLNPFYGEELPTEELNPIYQDNNYDEFEFLSYEKNSDKLDISEYRFDTNFYRNYRNKIVNKRQFDKIQPQSKSKLELSSLIFCTILLFPVSMSVNMDAKEADTITYSAYKNYALTANILQDPNIVLKTESYEESLATIPNAERAYKRKAITPFKSVPTTDNIPSIFIGPKPNRIECIAHDPCIIVINNLGDVSKMQVSLAHEIMEATGIKEEDRVLSINGEILKEIMVEKITFFHVYEITWISNGKIRYWSIN